MAAARSFALRQRRVAVGGRVEQARCSLHGRGRAQRIDCNDSARRKSSCEGGKEGGAQHAGRRRDEARNRTTQIWTVEIQICISGFRIRANQIWTREIGGSAIRLRFGIISLVEVDISRLEIDEQDVDRSVFYLDEKGDGRTS